jgi:hypothetical protein
MNNLIVLLRRAGNLRVVASLAIAFALGCGPKKPAVTSETGLPSVTHPDIRPVELQVAAGNGTMTVRWKQLGTGVISGYNIFVSLEPMASKSQQFSSAAAVAPHNTTVYAGDTNLEDEFIEYVAGGLDNGVKYYVSVRVVFPDQSISGSSNEVVAVCGPRGEFSLTVRYKSENDGFSLVTGQPVRADASDNDLYFFSKDGVDYLASPARLNAYLRKTSFSVVSAGGRFEDIRRKLATGKGSVWNGTDRVAVNSGNWLLLTTAENYSALVQVRELMGQNDSRTVTLWYALCPLAGEAVF